MLVLSFFLISLIQTDSVQGIRICGKRLADFLHFLCQHYGGFHSPTTENSGSYYRRNAPESQIESSVQEESEVLPAAAARTFLPGVVDECCRKQCTISTLISYCANGDYLVNPERLSELERQLASNSDRNLENQKHEDMKLGVTEQTDRSTERQLQAAAADFPNLGTSTRNRPVFIVLPQYQEVSNTEVSLEESI
ncbi:ilGF domain-containing protein [Caerostris darwini]|uniref:IlGF domain-containing protein n=1 Tax=Caerostris darwini TaxID=1538125 RepID=A0AAV4T2W9_9ARAC|nr:ilGF domain-containing protein [Caerostris darwini]